MGKLDGYSLEDRRRISALAAKFIQGMIDREEIPCTTEAIKAATPSAVQDAKEVINAVNEFLRG
jgi:hypothetical protein